MTLARRPGSPRLAASSKKNESQLAHPYHSTDLSMTANLSTITCIEDLRVVAQKRVHESAKADKDLLQAASLIHILKQSDPDAIEDALTDARGQGEAGWAAPINASLRALSLKEYL